MKSLFILFLCAVILGGCNSAIRENLNSELYGKWILVIVSGGIAGDINNINTEIERHILEFNENNLVFYFYNDSLVSTNNFSIEKRRSIYSADELDFIIYENQQAPVAIAYLSQDTLTLADNYYDGYTKVYIKQNE